MKFAYWLVNNEICGRPGPNEEPWDPQELYDGGIRAVLSVNKGDGVARRKLSRLGISYKRTTLRISTPPEQNNLQASIKQLERAYAFAAKQADLGRPLLVHCRYGHDRSGLFLAYYLCVRHNYTPQAAIEEVRSRRAACLRAHGWQRFTLALLREVTNNKQLAS